MAGKKMNKTTRACNRARALIRSSIKALRADPYGEAMSDFKKAEKIMQSTSCGPKTTAGFRKLKARIHAP